MDFGSVYVIYSDVDGVRDLSFSPRDGSLPKSLGHTIAITEHDEFLRIQIQDGMQVVGFFTKLRNTEVPITTTSEESTSPIDGD